MISELFAFAIGFISCGMIDRFMLKMFDEKLKEEN